MMHKFIQSGIIYMAWLALMAGCMGTGRYKLGLQTDEDTFEEHFGQEGAEDMGREGCELCNCQKFVPQRDNTYVCSEVVEADYYGTGEHLVCGHHIRDHARSAAEAGGGNTAGVGVTGNQNTLGDIIIHQTPGGSSGSQESEEEALSVEELLSARGVARSTIRTVTGKSPNNQLLWAAEHGHPRVVSKLLKEGVSPNIQDSVGNTPLHLAAWKGQTSTVRVLLKHQHIAPDLPDNEGWTPLMSAARYSKHAAPIARAILAHPDTNPNLRTQNNWTALMLAARYNDAATVKAIIAHPDTDPNLKQNDGWTALMLAARSNDAATVKAIIEHRDTNPNLQDEEDNWTALMHAAFHNDAATVHEILEHKRTDPNLQEEDNWTALMLTAQEGKTAVARALLKAGADTTLQTKKGNTARDLARQFGHTAIVNLIDQY